MNNKELTELKKFIDGRIEFLFDHWVEHDKPPYTFGGWREEVVNDIANKLTSSNDEIKREAVEGLKMEHHNLKRYIEETMAHPDDLTREQRDNFIKMSIGYDQAVDEMNEKIDALLGQKENNE